MKLPSGFHFLHIVCLVLWYVYTIHHVVSHRNDADPEVDPNEKYGPFITYFSIGVRLLGLLIIPQILISAVGLLIFDVQQPSVELKCSPLLAPFICIRVVTRGLYPSLVSQNVQSHLKVVESVGIQNYVIEIVTDNELNLGLHGLQLQHVKQTVVPNSYKSKGGTLNKARALQYCLEEGVNILKDDDWVVHLDEETRLTVNSLRGILNFIFEDRHQFGQGVITYAAQAPLHFGNIWTSIQNRLCTVADSFRVADDLGKHKAQFRLLHRPYFGIKGSFVISKFSAEKDVQWDFGPPGSKAEDAWMSLVAIDKGYTFDFVEGDMLERSPFTFADFFKQRKRWMQGIFMVVVTPTIQRKTRFLLSLGLISWLILPISTTGAVLQMFYPITLPYLWMDVMFAWVGATALYMYFIGYLRQFPISRMPWWRLVLLTIPEIVVASTLSVVCENAAVIMMWFGDWYSFYIVQKEVPNMVVEDLEDFKVDPQAAQAANPVHLV